MKVLKFITPTPKLIIQIVTTVSFRNFLDYTPILLPRPARFAGATARRVRLAKRARRTSLCEWQGNKGKFLKSVPKAQSNASAWRAETHHQKNQPPKGEVLAPKLSQTFGLPVIIGVLLCFDVFRLSACGHNLNKHHRSFLLLCSRAN